MATRSSLRLISPPPTGGFHDYKHTGLPLLGCGALRKVALTQQWQLPPVSQRWRPALRPLAVRACMRLWMQMLLISTPDLAACANPLHFSVLRTAALDAWWLLRSLQERAMAQVNVDLSSACWGAADPSGARSSNPPETFRSLCARVAGARWLLAAGSFLLSRKQWLLQRHAVFDVAWSEVGRRRVSDASWSHPCAFWFRSLCFCDVERRTLSNALLCVARWLLGPAFSDSAHDFSLMKCCCCKPKMLP